MRPLTPERELSTHLNRVGHARQGQPPIANHIGVAGLTLHGEKR
jgi:hypothetical protein